MSDDIQVGDHVHSAAIGRIPAFDGTVMEMVINGRNERIYHITDVAGKWWQRNRDELRKL